jgi:thiol-disulfide isomerase/thioredoxin
MALALGRELLLLVAIAVPLMLAVGWFRAPALPEYAPDFTLVDMGGQPVSLSDFRGQTVVLNFWATWCGPCRLEAPWFTAFAKAHPEVPVLGIVADGPVPKVRATMDDLGIVYPVVSADDAVMGAYGVSIFPTTVVVNPDGTVRWAHAGLMFRPQLAWATGHIW